MKQEINNFRPNSINFTFSNGNTIDAIFGWGTYSDNHDNYGKLDDAYAAMNTFMSSSTVESMFNCGPKLQKKIEKKYGEQPLCRISIDDWIEIAIQIKREKK